MAIVLVAGLWLKAKSRSLLKWLGVVILLMVIVQGALGGFRVTERSTFLAFLHGILGQVILGLTVLMAASLSRLWHHWSAAGKRATDRSENRPDCCRLLSIILLTTIFIQLVLGASVRHSGAWLAIPDFPTSYGRWLPPFSQPGIDMAISEMQFDQTGSLPYTVTQVWLHFAHRLGAAVVLVLAVMLMIRLHIDLPGRPELVGPLLFLGSLLLLQILLGVMIIWYKRPPILATGHQTVGAMLLAAAVWLTFRVVLIKRLASTGYDGRKVTAA